MTTWRPGSGAYWVAVHRDDDATRIEAGGELDLSAREAVRDAVVDALGGPAAGELIIDLREVTFIDAVAVHAAVIDSADVARAAGVRCRVLPSARVRRILEIAGLDEAIR
ncbi:MAG TPA: STAS domain-containing protein [Acidimicrobiales bacterium]|nr:STAS domain-containing protein [Acidimicrobiales bacterium]